LCRKFAELGSTLGHLVHVRRIRKNTFTFLYCASIPHPSKKKRALSFLLFLPPLLDYTLPLSFPLSPPPHHLLLCLHVALSPLFLSVHFTIKRWNGFLRPFTLDTSLFRPVIFGLEKRGPIPFLSYLKNCLQNVYIDS
jgi:hypothetical protein